MRPVLCFFPTPSARGNTTGPHAMGPLAPAIVLSVLLDPAFLLTRELQGECPEGRDPFMPTPWCPRGSGSGVREPSSGSGVGGRDMTL